MPTKPDLRDLTKAELTDWLAGRGQPAYRARQIWHGLYSQAAPDFAALKNLPRSLRDELEGAFTLAWPRETKQLTAGDGAEKIVFQFADESLETVWMPLGERATVCVSTQAGCRMACRFCRTGVGGFRRQLRPSEIVLQVLALKKKITNLVLMGMGEPLDNLSAVCKALQIFCDPEGLAFSPRRITLSTIGLPGRLHRLRELAPSVNLALSLHSAVPETRTQLLPVTRDHDLGELKAELRAAQQALGRKVTIEVVLIGGVNDSIAEARALARWLSGLSAKVNLIPFNAFPESDDSPPTREAVLAYQSLLREKKLPAFIRQSRGREILAACGQLRVKRE